MLELRAGAIRWSTPRAVRRKQVRHHRSERAGRTRALTANSTLLPPHCDCGRDTALYCATGCAGRLRVSLRAGGQNIDTRDNWPTALEDHGFRHLAAARCWSALEQVHIAANCRWAPDNGLRVRYQVPPPGFLPPQGIDSVTYANALRHHP